MLAQGGADELAVVGVVAGGTAPKRFQPLRVHPKRSELRRSGADGGSEPAADFLDVVLAGGDVVGDRVLALAAQLLEAGVA